MRLREDVLLTETEEGVIAVPTCVDKGFNGMIRMNGTAGFVAKCLQKDVTEDEIVTALTEKYDVTAEEARANAQKVIGGFRDVGLLKE